jgi:hypothetical protein
MPRQNPRRRRAGRRQGHRQNGRADQHALPQADDEVGMAIEQLAHAHGG